MSLDRSLLNYTILRTREIINGYDFLLLKEKGEIIDNAFNKEKLSKKLRIAYIMNHSRVCGGVKILLEHTNALSSRGHDVYILSRDAKPTWREIKGTYIRVPGHMSFNEALPDIDIIVTTVVDQVPELFLVKKAPIILFEQGDTYIYEFEEQDELHKDLFRKMWSFPVPIVSVSNILAQKLNLHFDRKSFTLNNALDSKVFFKRDEEVTNNTKLRIMFVGQEDNHFKGIKIIREALEIVKKTGRDFEEVWVTQKAPQSEFNGELVIDPSQELLGKVYREVDIFVSGSYYESFPLPPLEAMTSGCAVVSTDNEGVKEYGEHGVNCLLGKVGDPQSLAQHLIELIDNQSLREKLILGGYETASKYNWGNIIGEWETYLYGAIKIWETNFVESKTLRIETLPKELRYDEYINLINSNHESLVEDWCLYLFEGERISSDCIDSLKKIISDEINASFKLRVNYPIEIPDHPLIRYESRLFKKGQSPFGQLNSIPLPLEIQNSIGTCFIDDWLMEVRKAYRSKEYNLVIDIIKRVYSTLDMYNQLVATKWIILALIELDQFDQVITICNQVIEQDITYSDILYLFARVCLLKGRNDIAKQLLELANNIGTSIHFPESFKDMEHLSKIYIDQIN